MEVWTMGQIVDPNFRIMLQQDVENIKGVVILELADGRIKVSKRMAFMNLFWWPILTAFNIPIMKEDFIKRQPLNMDVFTKEWGKYYDKVIALDFHNAKRLKQVIWSVNEEIYKLCFGDLLPYTGTMDILDMADIMNDKPIKEILDSKEQIVLPGAKPKSDKLKDILDSKPWDTARVEEFIDTNSKKIMSILGTPGALKNQALLTYQSLGQLNPFQVPQTMFAFGPRTQLNDNIINYPVIGSALEGLRNINEYIIERMAAAKSAAYNKGAVSDAQYNGRKQHLQASTVRNLYAGDCGTTAYVEYVITKDIAKNFYGKNILDESSGALVTLSKRNIEAYLDKRIKMRSPMTCKFRHGVCEVCGGKLLENVNRKINVGILSAIRFQEPVTQKILSAKHLVKTKSEVYELDTEMTNDFESYRGSYIRIKKTSRKQLHGCYIGLSVNDFTGINDVPLLRDNTEINERKMSYIRSFLLADANRKVFKEYTTERGNQTPFLSSALLLYIRDIYDQVIQDNNIIWVPLDGAMNLMIFRTIVINDNMIEFVKSVTAFFGGSKTKHDDPTITSFHTCTGALEALSDLVYAKCKINIVHLEVLLKSYMITSPTDYNIPSVTDPDNVMFGTNEGILSKHHIGTKLLYECLSKYIKETPETYFLPKCESVFDVLVGFKPRQH